MNRNPNVQRTRPSFFSLMMVLLAAGIFLSSAAPAVAEYPEREITVIVPWAAGGGTDLITRFLADLMQKDLGKPVVVVNKPGGGGLVGFKQLAAAKPDGYTLGITTNSLILHKYSSSSYLDWRELAPIALHNNDPAGFTVNVDAPWKTIKEALDYARANPMKMRVGNSGPGAIWHVAAAMLGSKTGVQFTHVPYGGAAPAAVALAGGHIEATSVSPAEVGTLIRGGKLRLLAIASEKRDPLFSDVPTFKESGIDFVFGVWRCLEAPKGTPKEVIEKLYLATQKVVENHGDFLNERLTKLGARRVNIGPGEYANLLKSQYGYYGELIRGIKP